MLASIAPPMAKPPGYGKPPGTLRARGKKICSGTQTYSERKYLATTVQMPSSICASVPKKTSPSDRANRTTAIRSEPSARSPFRSSRPARASGPGSGFTAGDAGGAAAVTASPRPAAGGGAGGMDVWMAVLSIVASVELHGAREPLERRLLLADEVGRPLHLQEVRHPAARHHDAEDALRLAAPPRPGHVHVGPLCPGDLERPHVVARLALAPGLQPQLL